jgi:hypothetical protein
MERRMMIALPGIAALAASRAFSETDGQTTPAVSAKSLTAHTGSKSFYKVPKNGNKLTKYLNGLTALLSLTSAQQQAATAIFTTALSTRVAIKSSVKTARKALSDAVKINDPSGISQASASLAALMGQNVSNGALAHAALFQILTGAQQTTLSQLHG